MAWLEYLRSVGQLSLRYILAVALVTLVVVIVYPILFTNRSASKIEIPVYKIHASENIGVTRESAIKLLRIKANAARASTTTTLTTTKTSTTTSTTTKTSTTTLPTTKTSATTSPTTKTSTTTSPTTKTSATTSTSTSTTTTATTTATPNKPKVVFGATDLWHSVKWTDIFNFKHCEYSNCVCRASSKFVGVEEADAVIFGRNEWTRTFPNLSWQIRQKQYWFMFTDESGVFNSHKWGERFNNRFNGTMMYRKDATIYNPYGKTDNIPMIANTTRVNFAEGKTKAAFAYVSNCYNGNYDRLGVMEELAKYIPVDIFSNPCKGAHVKPPPCPRGIAGSNLKCETDKHKPYRFFLSFENTLCMDYITEKYWDRLKSTSYFIPIAMGGLSIKDYSRKSPPNSFLHVYNFTSIQKLGEHMKYLMSNDEAYNKYHAWRYSYSINTNRNIPACQMCKLLHEQPKLPALSHAAEWRNNASLCRGYDLKSQQGTTTKVPPT